MNEAIVHRGPDHGCRRGHGRCVLGYRRLVDHRSRDRRPAGGNERGDVVAVFNGEIYNFRELRARARGGGPRDPRHGRHAAHPARLRAVGPRLRRAPRGDVRDRALGRAARAARARPRPARQEAARSTRASPTARSPSRRRRRRSSRLPGALARARPRRSSTRSSRCSTCRARACARSRRCRPAPTPSSRPARSASSATGRRSRAVATRHEATGSSGSATR